MDFTEDQINRYARHILLKEVGGEGQARLLRARVLVVGAGGLGSPVLYYLGAAGIGTLGVVDADVVEISNLQRQILHTTARIGTPKVESAAMTIGALNPDVRVVPHRVRLSRENVMDLVADYDVVADCTDNFETRFLLNDACHFARKPLVSAAVLRFTGQVAVYKAWAGNDAPCYRCLFREPPPPGMMPSCAEAGVMGAHCGMIGSAQAVEIIKEILGIGVGLAGWLLVCEALDNTFRRVRVRRDPGCPLCGDQPTITGLDVHDAG